MPKLALANQKPNLVDALYDLYREADALFAGWSCPSSTKCCRFGITGREPYVTSIEWAVLHQAIRQQGGALSANRRALPLLPSNDVDKASRTNERICPLLNRDGRCCVYEARPFGCRTFFCADAERGRAVRHGQVRQLAQKLAALAAQHETRGDQVRPLGRILGI